MLHALTRKYTGREHDGDSRSYRSTEEQTHELTRSIRREVNKLSEQWNALIARSDAWKGKLDDTTAVSINVILLMHVHSRSPSITLPFSSSHFPSVYQHNFDYLNNF